MSRLGSRGAGLYGANAMGAAGGVALAAFWAAANEIVRLAPDDPVSLRILQEVERSAGGRGAGAADDTTNVVWF